MSKEDFIFLSDEQKIDYIKSHVCGVFGISEEDLESRQKTNDIVFVRTIFFYVCWLTRAGKLKDVSAKVKRDHSAACRGRDVARELIEVRDKSFSPFWEKYKQNATLFLIP